MRNTMDETEVREAVDELEMFARRLADEFWEENNERRKTSESGILGVRVRREEGARWFRVVWFWNRFIRNSDAEGGYLVRSNEISRNKQYAYSSNSFKKGKPWERALAVELEKRFGEIRKAQEMLKAQERKRGMYQRAAKKGMTHLDPEFLENLPEDTEKGD